MSQISNHYCASVALYDWDGELELKQFGDRATSFFAANHVSPDVGTLSAKGRTRNANTRKTVERLLRSDDLASADTLELYHTIPDYAQLIFGWDVQTEALNVNGRTIYFGCDQALAGIDLDFLEEVIGQFSQIVQLRYGIGYVKQFEFGPCVYAHGMVSGFGYSREDLIKADRIGAWFRERMAGNRHLAGLLRDVYPLNVISEPHLSQRVEGLPLADWIRQLRLRGTLRSLPGGATLWRIDEANIESVRAPLADAGLLIAYLPR